MAIVGESGDVGPSPRLWMMDADGRNAHLWLNWALSASLSPEGRSIAWVERTSPPTVRIVAADGRGEGSLLVRNGLEVDWSPDGKALAFVRFQGARGAVESVLVENLYTRRQRLVVRGGGEPDWSPDGRKLAFARGEDVWVVNVASKVASRLIRGAYFPRWSPDGTRLAFVRDSGVEGYVYIAHADGTAARRVREGDSVAWSPDGRELAIGELRRIIRVRADGTNPRVVHTGCCAWVGLDWR